MFIVSKKINVSRHSITASYQIARTGVNIISSQLKICHKRVMSLGPRTDIRIVALYICIDKKNAPLIPLTLAR